MKIITILLLFISCQVYAVNLISDNFIPVNKLDSCGPKYSVASKCFSIEGSECVSIPVNSPICSDYSLENELVDDKTKPIYSSPANEVICEDQTAMVPNTARDETGTPIVDDPSTTDVDESASLQVVQTKEQYCSLIKNTHACPVVVDPRHPWEVVKAEDDSKVYCQYITGYEQKESGKKVLVFSQTKKDARLAAEAQAKAIADELSQQKLLMSYGNEIIALIGIHNKKKVGLTVEQVSTLTSTYGNIQFHLQSGSLPTAKAMTEAITPDGTVVTEADKTYVVGLIQSYITKAGL